MKSIFRYFRKTAEGSEGKREAEGINYFTLKEAKNEDGRLLIYGKLADSINSLEEKIEPYRSAETHSYENRPLIIGYYGAESDEVTGGIYAGPSYDTAELEVARTGKKNKPLYDYFLKSTMWIHAVAAFGNKRSGIGSLLVSAVEKEAERAGYETIIAVSSEENIPFYINNGYKVSDRNAILALKTLGNREIGLPLEGESRWVVKSLTGDSYRFLPRSQ